MTNPFPTLPDLDRALCTTCGLAHPLTDLISAQRAPVPGGFGTAIRLQPVCRFCLEALVGATRMARVPK